MFRLAFLLLLLFCFSGLEAQKKESKAKKHYVKAYQAYSRLDYDEAIELADKALEKDSLHVNTLILFSNIYDLQRDPDKELKIYQILLRIDSTDIRSHQNRGNIFLKRGDFSKAYKVFSHLKRAEWLPERYLKLVNQNLERSRIGKYHLENPIEVNRMLLGDEVNSELNEYWPSMSPDGESMFFTRTNFSTEPMNEKLRREENIYVFTKKDQKVNKLPNYVNTLENEGAQCITQDGKTMFFTVCKTSVGTQGDCNIYTCTWRDNKWSKPKKLPSPVNTPFKETQPSISYDGKTLFFSSDRPGGVGGMDLWVSRMNPDSVWALPKNLGTAVNTPKNEESPFIHADNQSLYFSSTGHPGMGKGDFFLVRLAKGSRPINLGYPLNNHEMQLGIYVDLEGDFGYYASVDPETVQEKGLDIYRFDLPENVKPGPLKIIKGRLVDKETQTPIAGGFITVFNLSTNREVVHFQTDQQGGFKFGLPVASSFAILGDASGYLPHSIHSSSEDLPSDSLLIVALNPFKKGNLFQLQNIFFDFDSVGLKTTSFSEISYLADFLKAHPKVRIEIGGHTDNVGDDAYNLELSQNRAKMVRRKLEEAIGEKLKDRVHTKGYGETKPIAENDTEEGRRQNRRTEIRILSTDGLEK